MNEAEFKDMIEDSPFAGSPVKPIMLAENAQFQFRCHRNVKCWNACCSNIDIPLTPYDVLRLKKRLDMSSGDFLKQYSVPFEMDKDGMPGIKLNPVEGGTACQFMTPEGCGVYEDRPTACRYYPVALLTMRRSDEYVDRSAYAMVREPHCLGHFEDKTQTIEQYRTEQGVAEYDQKAHAWRQRAVRPCNVVLSGATMGIVGLGNIGRAIAKRARAFEMHVIAVDINAAHKPDFVHELWGLSRLSDLMKESDYVVVTVPSTAASQGMIGEREIALMKPTAMLLGMSRGGVVDQEALTKALKERKIRAAALDVFVPEPLPPESELWDMDNVLITAHIAGGTQHERASVVEILHENLGKYLRKDFPLRNQVDKKLGF